MFCIISIAQSYIALPATKSVARAGDQKSAYFLPVLRPKSTFSHPLCVFLEGSRAAFRFSLLLLCPQWLTAWLACGISITAGFLSKSVTLAGSLSAFASSRLICHICLSDKELVNPGIPVKRIPFATFQ